MSKTSLAVVVLAIATAMPASAEPPLWVIKTGTAEVFLFGQMGLKADTQWQSAKLRKAFDKSAELWTENPQEHRNIDPKLLDELSRNAHPLSDLLSDSDSVRLQTALKRAGVPPGAVSSMSAYVVLEDVLEKQAGIDASNLPERVFAKRAVESGKSIHSEFESLEGQLRFSAGLPDAVQAGLIKRALDDLDAGAPAVTERIAAWSAGNLALETAYVEHNCNLYPDMCRAIGTERNAEWVFRIKEMLSKPGTYFVCAGIGHFVGPDGIVAQLEAAGIRVKRN
ncbi:MAG: TraB/GumN family protein [Acidobacteriia bacterium]|nr:TraB/GumN family protein [Terriglobia bacterium]